MVKEVYVSFEVAKLLKEKGFDEPIKKHYYDNGVLSTLETEYLNWNLSKTLLSAPTHQMALAWLREKENRYISIVYSYICNKYKVSIDKFNAENISDLNNNLYTTDYIYSSYEAAIEAALKYSLENLI